jgi:hypothetical protein
MMQYLFHNADNIGKLKEGFDLRDPVRQNPCRLDGGMNEVF